MKVKGKFYYKIEAIALLVDLLEMSISHHWHHLQHISSWATVVESTVFKDKRSKG